MQKDQKLLGLYLICDSAFITYCFVKCTLKCIKYTYEYTYLPLEVAKIFVEIYHAFFYYTN